MKSICLAAGKGSRINSSEDNIPKVLRKVNEKALISYVLSNINFIDAGDIVIVVGFEAEQVKLHCGDEYKYAYQEKQLGTGHAVMCAESLLADYDTDVLICLGDMPLISRESYLNVVKHHQNSGADCTILTAVVSNPPAFGRIIRKNNSIVGIVEQKDCTPQQLKINELNIGVFVCKSKILFKYLSMLKCDNAQSEYYLTDLPELLLRDGKKIEGVSIINEVEHYGVSTKEDLLICERYLNN